MPSNARYRGYGSQYLSNNPYSTVLYGFDFDLSHRAQKQGKSAFLNKSYVLSSNRRFEKEGWLNHLWLATKRYYIDERLFHKGMKSQDHIAYKDHR